MPRELTTPVTPPASGGTPLSRTAWRRRRRLSALALVAFLAASATLRTTGTHPHRIAGALLPGARSPAPVPGRAPLADLAVQIEVAALVGAAVAGGALLIHAERDVPGVRLRRGAVHLAWAAPAFVVGAVATHQALVRPILALPELGRAVVDPRWLAEVALFFPITVGLGAALPLLVVGLVRARAVPRYTSDRQRGLAALWIFAFAAAYSPPDLATFAAFAAPPVAGIAVALAWCEFA